jgi:probable rRNA maturation factor
MKVEIRMDPGYRDPVLRRAIREAALAAMQSGKAPRSASLTVLVSGDQTIRSLNARFRGIDAPTDVLSFPAGDADGYLGDIAISVETARRQAEAGGHTLTEEVELLVVHGVLHLLGHDHARPEEKSAMWSTQADVLDELGNPLSPP